MSGKRAVRAVWTVCMIGAGAGIVALTFSKGFSLAEDLPGGYAALFAVVAGVAFLAEYLDSSLGMGYGTTLTPILMIVGFEPIRIVPAVLLSEFVSGISAGLMHHRAGNVDLGMRTEANRIVRVIAACSVVGTVVAVVLAVKLPAAFVKGYIGVMILAIGVFLLVKRRTTGGISMRKIVTLGTVAAFNKGLSGGGYGPLVTGGQILSGVPEKNAVGITSFAEGLVCLVGLVLYLALHGLFDWRLAAPLVTGAALSVPAATLTVKVLPADLLRKGIGVATAFLGVVTLVKLL